MAPENTWKIGIPIGNHHFLIFLGSGQFSSVDHLPPPVETPGFTPSFRFPASGATGTVEGKKESHTASSSGSSMTSWESKQNHGNLRGPPQCYPPQEIRPY